MTTKLPGALIFENVKLRDEIDRLKADLHNARKENDVLRDELRVATERVDRLTHRLAIARGEGDRQ